MSDEQGATVNGIRVFKQTISLVDGEVHLEIRLVAEREVDFTINGISVTREDFLAVKHCHDAVDMREAIGADSPDGFASIRELLEGIDMEINALRFAIVDGTT